jgi:Zn-dependent protease
VAKHRVSAGQFDSYRYQGPAVPPPPTTPPTPPTPPAPPAPPEAPELGWAAPTAATYEPTTLAAPTTMRDRWQKFTGGIAAAFAALWKLKVLALLVKLKFFTVAGSMALSILAYGWLFGWKFGVGFVLLILVHELGHVIVLRARGIKAGAPVFIPFMGAFVSMKQQPKTVYDEALSGIAGPAFGGAASFALLLYADAHGSAFLKALAYTGFFLNLFNLLPVLPLDGGRTAAALHPAFWAAGLAGLVALMVWRPSPLLPIILIFGGMELYRRWQGRDTEESRRYYAIKPLQRTVIAVAYLGLMGLMVVGMNATYVHQTFTR